MKRSRKSTTSESSLEEEIVNQDKLQRKPKAKLGRMHGDSEKEIQTVEEEVTLHDIFAQITSVKKDISESFSTLSIRIDQLRFELTDKIKLVSGDVQEIKESTEKAWEEISDLKSNMAKNTQEVNTMKSKYKELQQEIQTLRRKNNDLEQYTRKENLRLLFVPEEDDENCEEVVVRCLTEMGINPASMNFHAVHRVGKKKPSPTNSTEEVSPKQIIVRFISRKDRDNVWENRGKVKSSTDKLFENAFFVPDLTGENAEISYKLRKAARRAREKYKMKVSIRNNRLCMVESGMSYGLNEIPQFLSEG